MEAGAPLSSKIKRLCLAAAVLLSACASNAPVLPVDTTSTNRLHDSNLADFQPSDQAMSCADIFMERAKTTEAMRVNSANIEANHDHNKATQYLGAFLSPVALLAAERNDTERAAFATLYARQDTLIKLAALKACHA